MARIYFTCVLPALLLIIFSGPLYGQQIRLLGKKKNATNDTIFVEAGKLLIFPDTLFIPSDDTVIVVPPGIRVKVRENPYAKSDRFYDSLQIRSYKNVVTRKLHQLVFRSRVTELSDSINLLRAEAPFEPYSGKTISKIHIRSVEFLSGNIIDTAEVVKGNVANALDKIHADTKTRIVRKSLLFETGDQLSPYRLADNERILRDLPFIRDARILVLPELDNDQQVEVYVVTQDRLSLFIDGDFGGFDDFRLEVGSRSFLGTGNNLSVAYEYYEDERPKSGYELDFKDFNLRGTFMSLEGRYSNLWDREGYEVILSREFLTPETKWAGGFEFGDLSQIRFEHELVGGVPSEEDSIRIPYQRNFQDAWLGRAFLLKGADNRINLSLATRVFREDFTERPYVDADSNQFFFNDLLFLNEVVLTKRKFLKSTLIQAFGITEDIPIGYLFKLVGGYEFGEFEDRPYIGLGASAGDFWKGVGYFTASAEFGGFIDDGKMEEGLVDIEALYFSPLLRFHRNQFRQFVNIEYTTTVRPIVTQQFGFNDEIRGIDRNVQGDRKFSVNFESVLFHPLKFYGFRMATFAFYDFGWISFGGPLISSDNFQSAVGIGLRLRNESLLFRTIQLRLGYLTASSELDVSFSFSNPIIFGNFRTSKPTIVEF